MTQGYELKEVWGERRRLLQGFSRYGYVPQTALADLIDNSLAAGATEVRIEINELVDGSYQVLIVDNGKGMTATKLESAIAFGSPKDIQDSQLSKFGFGMKTASLEVSPDGFSILTRSQESGEVCAASLLESDQQGIGAPTVRFWEKDAINPTWLANLNALAGSNGSGTVVIWENADLKAADHYKKVLNEPREQFRRRIENRISQYLGMVFHRWIEGTTKDGYQTKIVFQGVEVQAWNPLLPEYLDESQVEPIEPFTVRGDDGEQVELTLAAWVMKKGVPKQIAERVARKNNAYQGVYLYRMDRIINNPTWFNIRSSKRDPLNGLRFSLELSPQIDDKVHLDVRKSSVDLPDDILDAITPSIENYMKIEEKRANTGKKDLNKTQTPAGALERAANRYTDLDKVAPTVRPERQSKTEVLTTNQDGVQLPLHLKELPTSLNAKHTVHLVSAAETSGLLWEPRTARDLSLQLLLNQDHDFYQKVILPSSEAAYEGFISLLIAFSRAELATQYSEFKRQFDHMRRHMSDSLEYMFEDVDVPDLSGDYE